MFGVDCCRCGGVREDMRQDVGEQAGYVDAPSSEVTTGKFLEQSKKLTEYIQ